MRADIKAFLKLALSLKQEDGPCLEWPFGRSGNYGRFWCNRKNYMPHRFICEIVYGKAPTTKHECAHSCHNALCIRPSHLRWATSSENKEDQLSNVDNKNYKLTKVQALEIRDAPGKLKDIALAYGITIGQVSHIKRGHRWK